MPATSLSAFLPAVVSACLPACPPACLSACLPTEGLLGFWDNDDDEEDDGCRLMFAPCGQMTRSRDRRIKYKVPVKYRLPTEGYLASEITTTRRTTAVATNVRAVWTNDTVARSSDNAEYQ